MATVFQEVLADHTAGSPMAEELVWTDLTKQDIAERMTEQGMPVSVHIVEQLLEEQNFHRRQSQKQLPMGSNPDRNAQFENIARLKREYQDRGEPVLSIDTKKRELIGNFQRKGSLYVTETLRTFDHDFPKFADGVVIPHGVYDLQLNRGYVHLGTSHDTSEFACDCLENWWQRSGREHYPRAESVLLLCDGGGSNSASTYLFKYDLQKLVNRLGLTIRVAHYPPYTSKYNPIEHRLFCHLTRACQGVVFKSLELVKHLMEKTRTRTGLSVVVDLLEKTYETGRRLTTAVKNSLPFIRDTVLPKWNYRVVPQ
jgi:hypothetical protein